MIEELLEAAIAATFDKPKQRQIIRQILEHPSEEIVPVMLNAFHQPPPVRHREESTTLAGKKTSRS